MAEIVLWQYRWLNPANDPNQPPSMLEWKEVQPWSRIQTMEQRIEELRDFRYDGKPAYEVRALGVITDGVDVPRKITSLAEFCAEGERLGLTAFDLAEALKDRPEFADCLPQLDAATVKAGEPEDVRAWLDSRRNAGVKVRPPAPAMDPQRERESAISIAQECGAFRFIWKMAQDPPSYTRFTDAQLAAFVARIRNAGVKGPDHG